VRQLEIALLFLGAFILSACHSHPKKAPADPPQNVSSGSTLTLNRAIVIPKGSTAVHFQDTQLIEVASIQPNYAYCKFEHSHPASAAHKVEPQAFTVASVDYDEQSVGSMGEPVSSTRMNLQSGQQAAAYRMTCMLPAGPDSAHFVTVYEINGALGNYFTLTRVY